LAVFCGQCISAFAKATARQVGAASPFIPGFPRPLALFSFPLQNVKEQARERRMVHTTTVFWECKDYYQNRFSAMPLFRPGLDF
jgi:hypothetical protein